MKGELHYSERPMYCHPAALRQTFRADYITKTFHKLLKTENIKPSVININTMVRPLSIA